jgi:surfeit locus 1 family protein
VRSPLIAVLGLLVAALCVRLGLWQLDRRAQRQAYNVEAAARLDAPPKPLTEVQGDSAAVRLQRVRAAGRWRYDLEVAWTARSRNGSPGVYLMTPLALPGRDTLVLVARGWVYAADAATADFARWTEGDSARLDGFVLPFPRAEERADTSGIAPRAVIRLDRERLQARWGVPLAPYYVVLTAADSTPGREPPARLAPPVVTDEGQHLSYAVQWFLFATIFGAGSVLVVWRARRPSGQQQQRD